MLLLCQTIGLLHRNGLQSVICHCWTKIFALVDDAHRCQNTESMTQMMESRIQIMHLSDSRMAGTTTKLATATSASRNNVDNDVIVGSTRQHSLRNAVF